MADRIGHVSGTSARVRVLRAGLNEGSALPASLTSFVGRRADVAAVSRLLLRDDVRLVTLVGPAGVGKTRLALEVAADLMHAYPDGVRFIALGSVLQDDLVVPTIARELGVWETAHRSVADILIETLRTARLLLVLDNLEQVARAAPALGELLSSCPGLHMLLTSRALLRISGEHAYPVPPLPVPDDAELPALDELGRIDAVRLFVLRAGAARAGFAIEDGNAQSIATICRRLDGLPLAIELAAARVAHLPPTAILARLSPALPLLTRGPSDAPQRQRTMRDAVAWSYDLLQPDEQRVIRRLSVFVGGFTLEAAAAVARFDLLDAGDILSVMSALVDQSLVSQADGTDGEPRFAMLEAIREYGLEELARTGEEPATRTSHADHYLKLVETASMHLVGAGQRAWLDRLELELANVRVALSWREGPEDDERALRMTGALAMLWYVRNHLREGWELAQRALAESSSRPTAARAGALRAAGMMAFARGDYAAATAFLRSSLPIAESDGDVHGVALAWVWLGLVAEYEGDDDAATRSFERALDLFRSIKEDLWTALTVSALGDAACRRGELDHAGELCAEGLALARAVGDRFVLWNCLQTQGNLELARDDWERAAHTHWEEVSVAQDIGDLRGVADGLAGMAGAAVGRHESDAGARLLGKADRLRATIGRAKLPGHAQFERAVSSARADLGDDAFQAAWDAGATLTLDDAIALARAPLLRHAAIKRSDTGAPTHGLSPREIDVLCLLVEGRSDRQIAEALFISRRTAAGHVASIVGKLDAVSRTDAAVRAVRLGIV